MICKLNRHKMALENNLRMFDVNDDLFALSIISHWNVILYKLTSGIQSNCPSFKIKKWYANVSILNCSNMRICLTALYKHDDISHNIFTIIALPPYNAVVRCLLWESVRLCDRCISLAANWRKKIWLWFKHQIFRS